mgnify:CR=1 FL=1|tara:strand:- start:153 stop:443 length:291 start_codon:yes stop_codon:yes gene_type:complete
MYRAEVDMFYKQHDKNFEIGKKRQTFTGINQNDVYSYIKYYCLKFGMCDVKMVDEGEIGAPNDPLEEKNSFAFNLGQTRDFIQEELNITGDNNGEE